jgi:hypothetical protein
MSEVATDKQRASEYDDSESVNAYLKTLEHPLKPVIEAIRHTILETDSRVTEGIKWNSASFYYYGWFATINIRAKNGVQVVLHHGAKTQDNSTSGLTLDDPSQLLTWPARDRAIATFSSADNFKSSREAFKKIIMQWAGHQEQLANSV